MAAQDNKVNGRWVGPGGTVTYEGIKLDPGVTVHRVGVFELHGPNWEPADAAAKKAYAAWLKLDSPELPNLPGDEVAEDDTAPEGDD